MGDRCQHKEVVREGMDRPHHLHLWQGEEVHRHHSSNNMDKLHLHLNMGNSLPHRWELEVVLHHRSSNNNMAKLHLNQDRLSQHTDNSRPQQLNTRADELLHQNLLFLFLRPVELSNRMATDVHLQREEEEPLLLRPHLRLDKFAHKSLLCFVRERTFNEIK